MKFWMLGLVLTLFTPVAFSRTPPQTKAQTKKTNAAKRDPLFPLIGKLVFEGKVVRGSVRKSEIDSLLARRVYLGGNVGDEYGKYGLGFIYAEGKLPAFSCQEWAQSRAAGLNDNFNTYERTMESFFIETCSILLALKDARPPKLSFITNPEVGLANLNLLPVNLLNELSGEDEEELNKLTARGVRISNLVAKREVKVLQKTTTSAVLQYDFDPETKKYSSEMHLEEKGRADFDGDGIEDIFISSADYATEGTFRHYDYFLLTRHCASCGFEVKKLDLHALKEMKEESFAGLNLKSSQLTKVIISKQEYGKDWPFEVERGELACVKAGSIAVFFTANGTTYPLNAWARGSRIDGKAVATDATDGPNLSAGHWEGIFRRAFAMCQP